MMTQFKRIFKAGIINFWRNRFVSLSSILVMTITLFVISELIFSGALLNSTLKAVQDKVDVNVYFQKDVSEEAVIAVKGELEKMPEVERVEYVSKEQALNEYRNRNADDENALKVLDELGENPLGAILNIKAKNPSQYEGVANVLSEKYPEGGDVVDVVNYNKNKVVIDRLNSIIESVRTVGTGIAILLAIISFIITLNTIRLVIYISREEIGVMRLVGASNSYVRGPFIISGMLYGTLSALVVLIIQWPLALWANTYIKTIGIPLDIVAYYASNFLMISGIVLGSGIFLGMLSSYVATRRYLS